MTDTDAGLTASSSEPSGLADADEVLEAASVDGLDLTPLAPLATPTAKAAARRRHSTRNWLIMGGIAVVLGFLLYQALTSARVYYLNVDEAVARRTELGSRNLRIQGEVTQIDGVDPSGALNFTMQFNGAQARVHHVGDDPSNLFAVGQKAVVDGHWQGDVFSSSQILMKHSESYVEANPDRLQYEERPGGATPTTAGSTGSTTG